MSFSTGPDEPESTPVNPGGRSPAPPVAENPAQSRICQSYLSKLAKTPDKKRRLAILKACAKVEAPWVEALFWESLSDASGDIRDLIIRELALKPSINLKLAAGRLNGPPWYAKSAALKIIGRHKIREAVAEIRRVVGDANVDVRRSAAEALAEIGGKDALALLVEMKKDPNSYVRMMAEEGIEKVSEIRFS
jgi:HEAT repeat protein